MTQVTEHRVPLSADDVPVQGGRSVALATAFVRGGLAAGLGLGALAVLATAAWIASPYPAGGPGAALHTAAGLWLLAHGSDLLRTDTLSGLPAPLGLTPLLVTALPLWLAHRAARDTLDPDGGRPAPPTAGGLAAVCGGYLLVAAGVVVYTESGPLPADLLTAGIWTPASVLAAAGAGAWTAHGRPLPGREEAAVALRAAGLALAALCGGGAVLIAVALLRHSGDAQASLAGLAGEWSGRASLGLLTFALLPNAVLWGAAYGLGPGFALGTGALVTPLGFTGTPAVPDFPLLAALPAEGRGMWLHWTAAAVPATAALLLGRRVGRASRAWPARATVEAALLAAAACGLAVAALAAAAGGPLGGGRLAAFGPVWWQTGAAALLWCTVVGVPTALAVRAWGRRGVRAAPVPAPLSVPAATTLPEPAQDREPDAADAGDAQGGDTDPAVTDGMDALDALDALDDGSGDDSYGFLPAAWEPPAEPPVQPPVQSPVPAPPPVPPPPVLPDGPPDVP
ncbi:DUF6350 family protein [Streptomyces sp. NPDC085481]|uniref:cell division protein PerM n=1 Tax=Streptomyces sp. NPDC085481 TaxID=3365727 RepID=UPI0037D1A207